MSDYFRSSPTVTHEIVSFYVDAKTEVFTKGFIDEVVWQGQVCLSALTPSSFMREAAWVVLSAGFSERSVRTVFERLEPLSYKWDAKQIALDDSYVERASAVFGNRRKVQAIGQIAEILSAHTGESLRAALEDDCESFLKALPFIGPVTWKHLAKNIGLQVSKNDRHLVRLASELGRSSVADLCQEIADWLGEPVSVVDLVLWRHCVLTSAASAGKEIRVQIL